MSLNLLYLLLPSFPPARATLPPSLLPSSRPLPLPSQAVSVKVSSANVAIVDHTRKCVASQLLPDWNFDAARPVGSAATGSHRLFWVARVPAMGVTTYLLGRQESLPHCQKAQISRLSMLDAPAEFECPKPYRCMVTGEEEDVVTLANKFVSVSVFAGIPQIESLTVRGDGCEGQLVTNHWLALPRESLGGCLSAHPKTLPARVCLPACLPRLSLQLIHPRITIDSSWTSRDTLATHKAP